MDSLDLNPIERPLSREEWRNDNHEVLQNYDIIFR